MLRLVRDAAVESKTGKAGARKNARSLIPVQEPRAPGGSARRLRTVASLYGTTAWADETGTFTASVRVTDGSVRVALDGRLVGGSLPVGRRALAAALGVRAPRMVLDLADARLDRRSIEPLAALIRSANHFGVVPQLRGLPVALRGALAQVVPGARYGLIHTVPGVFLKNDLQMIVEEDDDDF